MTGRTRIQKAMFAGCLSWWTALWVISYLQLVHGQIGDCGSCDFHAEDPTYIWAWAANGPSEEDGTNEVGVGVPVMNSKTITLTQTIVTIINTVLDTTTTTTLINYPDGQAPLTNDAGTRIETISYSRLGETHTTILTFPHPFVLWPESYSWTSFSGFTSVSGFSSPFCASATGDMVTIRSNPQSDYDAVSPKKTGPYNSLGSGYYLASGYWNDQLFSAYSDQFPDQSAIQDCTIYSSGGPAFGGFTVTQWMNETSVSIEDAPASTTTSSGADLTTHSVITSDSSLSPTGTTDIQSTSTSATSSDAERVTATLFIRSLSVVGLAAVAVLV